MYRSWQVFRIFQKGWHGFLTPAVKNIDSGSHIKAKIIEKTLRLGLYFAVDPDSDIGHCHRIPPIFRVL
jgi:hypothetical protein